jgi:rRNA small subunit pseudouridine methyltransferase Nep1
MLYLILADSELELIPKEIWNHKSVQKTARMQQKHPSEMLLDSSLHYQAMTTLSQGDRRGRPDIVHVFLLVANESILNRENILRIIVHSRHNACITINPKTRIIKNYSRFKGLMEQLFATGVVPTTGEPLMTLKKATLDQILREIDPDTTVLFSTEGQRINPSVYLGKEKTACIIGGFPRGSFLSAITADHIVSLYPSMLPAWSVAMEVIVAYEYTMNITYDSKET